VVPRVLVLDLLAVHAVGVLDGHPEQLGVQHRDACQRHQPASHLLLHTNAEWPVVLGHEEASAPNHSRFLAGLTKPEQFPVLVEVRETPQVADVPQPDEEERS
jgi:hypothetical protein